MQALLVNNDKQSKIFVGILTAKSLSPTAREHSLAAGLPGANEATNTPLSIPMPLSENEARKRIELKSTVCIPKYALNHIWYIDTLLTKLKITT